MRRSDLVAQLQVIWEETIRRGETLPSEDLLAAELQVARSAVREALIRMEADGLIRRLHGAGTYPNPTLLTAPVRLDRRSGDLTETLASQGHEVRVEVLSAGIVPVPEGRCEALDLEPGAEVVHIVKRWFADGVPAVVADDVVPLKRPPPWTELEDASVPVFELLDDVGLGTPDWMSTHPTATAVTGDLARALDLDDGSAVLVLEHLGIDRFGQRVFHAIEHHRTDILRFGLVRTVD